MCIAKKTIVLSPAGNFTKPSSFCKKKFILDGCFRNIISIICYLRRKNKREKKMQSTI